MVCGLIFMRLAKLFEHNVFHFRKVQGFIRVFFFINLLQNLVFDLESQVHIIKHFSKLNNNYIAYLQKEHGISAGIIDEKLSLGGSIFHYSFASNPLQLIKQLSNADKIEIIEESLSENIELRLRFSYSDFPEGIGTNNLIHKNTLSEEQKSRIENRVFSGENIQFVKSKPQKTKEIIFIASKKDSKFHIITIFPGMYAPTFPLKNRQSTKDYYHCREFWDNYVFIFNI